VSRRGDWTTPRFVVLDKTIGCTSFDCVRRLRSIVKERRVGHAGTLDPFASGVLVCGVGPATRLLSLLSEGQKEYVAELRFGVSTDSLDCTGEVIEELPADIAESDLRSACGDFLGEQMQVPPQLSAVKIEGQRSYRRFRDGDTEFELEARPIRIDSIDVEAASRQVATLRVVCGGGTYIRSLARDLGHALGTVAHLSALRRTRIGPFSLADAVTLDSLGESAPEFRVGVFDAAQLVREWPRVHLDAEEVLRLRQGQQPDPSWLDLPDPLPPRVAFLDSDDGLVAVAELRESELRLRTVLPGQA
jgi:tRNA pseudouridine55 synthase